MVYLRVARLLISTWFVVATVLSSSNQVNDPCCETMVIDHKRHELVYPLAWLPYVQNKIYFSIDADHDAVISLSKHTDPMDPRYLLVFQEDRSNKASIRRCRSNPPSFRCEDEVYAPSSQPYLINGTSKYYWMSIDDEDFTLTVGKGGETSPFLSFTPNFGTEIGIRWIGLGTKSGADTRLKWEFCDLALKDISRQKPSFQSSNLYEGANTYDATLANGYNSSLQLPGPCSQTAYLDIEPWWRVDLLAVYDVKLVRLWNDIDDERRPMEGVSVYVGTMPSFTNIKIREQNKLCGAGAVLKYEAENDAVIVRSCDSNMGRYVYVVKITPRITPVLKLCGVEVFGKAKAQQSSSKKTCKHITGASNSNAGSSSVALSCILCLLLLSIIIGTGWVYFAYNHPSSPSGLFLLKISGRFHKDDVSSGQVAKYTLVTPTTANVHV